MAILSYSQSTFGYTYYICYSI